MLGKNSLAENGSQHKTAVSPAGGLFPDLSPRNTIALIASKNSSENIEKAVSGRILQWVRQDDARKLLAPIFPDHRLLKCLQYIAPGQSEVQVRLRKTGSAYYKNLIICGSCGVCPICAYRVGSSIARDLRRGLAARRDTHLPVLLTFTVRHKKTDDLINLLCDFKSAMRDFKSGTNWNIPRKALDMRPIFSAEEITRSADGIDNGYHLHAHLLVMVAQNALAFLPEFERKWRHRWRDLLMARGRSADELRCLEVTADTAKTGDYVAKWGAAEEVALSAAKRGGKNKGYSWLQWLDLAGAGDAVAGNWYRDYAIAYYAVGGKFKRWANGARAWLGLGEEQSDEQIARAADAASPEDTVVGRLSWDLWQVIRKSGKRGELLEQARLGSESLSAWLRENFGDWMRVSLEAGTSTVSTLT